MIEMIMKYFVVWFSSFWPQPCEHDRYFFLLQRLYNSAETVQLCDFISIVHDAEKQKNIQGRGPSNIFLGSQFLFDFTLCKIVGLQNYSPPLRVCFFNKKSERIRNQILGFFAQQVNARSHGSKFLQSNGRIHSR